LNGFSVKRCRREAWLEKFLSSALTTSMQDLQEEPAPRWVSQAVEPCKPFPPYRPERA
jgi:hypothetical protein